MARTIPKMTGSDWQGMRDEGIQAVEADRRKQVRHPTHTRLGRGCFWNSHSEGWKMLKELECRGEWRRDIKGDE